MLCVESIPACVVVLGLSSAGVAAPFFDDFEADAPGQLPGAPWSDIAGSISAPTVPSPTGTIVLTPGRDAALTQAFQISRAKGTSQGIIAPIPEEASHRLAADIRIDAHPSREVYGNWNAAFGFIQDRGVAADINNNPQGLVYVYQQKWWFFGATVFGGNSTEVLLSSVPITPGDWYHVAIDADTASGLFHVSIEDAGGASIVDRAVSIPNFNPALGRYNRIAAFDGDYAGAAVTSGQFTIDNVSYIPSPSGVLTCVTVVALSAFRRRRC